MTQHEKDVEKVARAIHAAYPQHPMPWDELSGISQEYVRLLARAALAAMKPAPLEPIPGSGPLK